MLLLLLFGCLIIPLQSTELQDDYTDPSKTVPTNPNLQFLALRSVLTETDAHKTFKNKLDLYHYLKNNDISSGELICAQCQKNITEFRNFLDDPQRQYLFHYKNLLFLKRNYEKKFAKALNYFAVFDAKNESVRVIHFLPDFEVKILEKATMTEFIPDCLAILCTPLKKKQGKYFNDFILYSLNGFEINDICSIITTKKPNIAELENVLHVKGLKFKHLPKAIPTQRTLNQEELLRYLKKAIDTQTKYSFETHYPRTTKDHFKKTLPASQQTLGSIQFKNTNKSNIPANTLDID